MWIWVQKLGALYRNDQKVASGYSGKGEGKNNPSMQNIKSTGPVPCGFYTIGKPFNSLNHGPLCLPLTPDKGNEMFGRSAFLIHGDSIKNPGEASEGCIILNRFVREQIYRSGDDRLEVKAEL